MKLFTCKAHESEKLLFALSFEKPPRIEPEYFNDLVSADSLFSDWVEEPLPSNIQEWCDWSPEEVYEYLEIKYNIKDINNIEEVTCH